MNERNRNPSFQGLDSSFEQSPRGGIGDSSSPASGQSPRPTTKPRLSVRPMKTVRSAPPPLSIARPYPHIAAHLTFSQAHGQFVLDADDDAEVRTIKKNSVSKNWTERKLKVNATLKLEVIKALFHTADNILKLLPDHNVRYETCYER